MNRSISIERFKTIFMVVLFITTILLFYFLWKDIATGGLKLPIDFLTQEQPIEVPTYSEVIKPESISVNFGGEIYTKLTNTDTYWPSFINELSKFGESQNIAINEITREQYDKVNSYRSIEVNFNYWLPFLESCAKLGIKTQTAYSQIEAVTKLSYSTASPESILIFDGKNRKYYRLASAKDTTKMKELITNVENAATDKYYQLGTYLGIQNPTLMPISEISKSRPIDYKQELYATSKDDMQIFSESFFGKGFDFVRKVTESDGTNILMYGYGEKILILNKDGSAEYKEDYQADDYLELSFYDSLDLAMKFISEHGSWQSMSGTKLNPRLISVTQVKVQNKTGYKFVFNNSILGEPIYCEGKKNCLLVETLGSKITRYSRDMIDIDMEQVADNSNLAEMMTIAPIDIISKDFKYIDSILSKEGVTVLGDTDAKLFENTGVLITNIKTGYFKQDILQSPKSQRLLPAWIIEVSGIQIYFGLYDGKQLGYSTNNN